MSTATIEKQLPCPTTPAVTVPAFPSKSETHRLLISAALADRETRIACPAVNADMLATANCLTALGASVLRTEEGFSVRPIDTRAPHTDCASLDVGESGSTLRFLLPILPALGIPARITMHGRLPERPLAPLDGVLTAHGASLSREADGTLSVCGRICAGNYTMDGGVSSQFASGLLFALPLTGGDSTLTLTGRVESAPYIGMTLDALARFGVQVTCSEDFSRFDISGNTPYRAPSENKTQNTDGREEIPTIPVGGDWSGAAFYLAAGAVGKVPVTVTGLDTNSRQGDREILPLLRQMGTRTEISGNAVTVYPSALSGISVDAQDIPDLVPVLAVLGAYASGETVIRGAARLRLKESDRLAAVSELLLTLGGEVTVTEDGLRIRGSAGRLNGGSVSSAGDHRIAMSAAVAALFCTSPVTVTGAEAVEKSAPDFWEQLQKLAEVEYHV